MSFARFGAALAAILLLSSHDLFLKFDSYYLTPNSEAEVALYNGTFEKSGNAIRRGRMADISVVSHGARIAQDSMQWTERDSSTVLRIRTGAPGTYVAGVSLDPWTIMLSATDFNNYLASDGGSDMLEARRAEGVLSQDAIESYAKHAKTIFQVGDTRSEDWSTPLGYPLEFVPMLNPYELHPGDTLDVKLLLRGEPLANQLVLIGTAMAHNHEHSHPDGSKHSHEHSADHDHANAEKGGNIHSHEHEHSDGGQQSHEHSADHEHADVAKGSTHSHEHAHADGSKHSHVDTNAAKGSKHSHEHAHADGSKHSHEHTADHEHTDAAKGSTHSQEHVHADGIAHSHDANSEGSGKHAHGHSQDSTVQVRTNAEGLLRVPVTHDGRWHLRSIHMVKSDKPDLTHVSNWATLSFEVAHDRLQVDHQHDEGHSHSDGLPTWAYWLGSLLLVGGLFIYFKQGQ